MVAIKWGMVGDLHVIAHAEMLRRVRQKIPEGGFVLVNMARKWATLKDDRNKRFRVFCGDVVSELRARKMTDPLRRELLAVVCLYAGKCPEHLSPCAGCKDEIDRIKAILTRELAAARKAERERAAKVLDNWPTPDLWRDKGAAAIRALED